MVTSINGYATYYQRNSEIQSLFLQARQLMQSTVRSWYPGVMFFQIPEFTQGNPVARMVAWQRTSTRLSEGLNILESQITFGMVPNHAPLMHTARMRVQQAVNEMWPGALVATMPLGARLSESEEFTQYLLGAQYLATQLAPLCAQAYTLQMGGYAVADPDQTMPGNTTLHGSTGPTGGPSSQPSPNDLNQPRDLDGDN